MKIVISGGHLTPALAMIDHIQAQHPTDVLYFIGRRYSQDKNKQLSNEAKEVEQRGVKFFSYSAPKLGQNTPVATVLLAPRMVKATLAALWFFIRHRPDVFLSFGGYLAVPLAVAAAILGIPTVTHEQTKAAGFANQLIAKVARKVALSDAESKSFFPSGKTILTGNPLRPKLFEKQPTPAWYPSGISKPILYITGGNQGSEILNTTTQHVLRNLVSQWFVIHQCGNATQRWNYKAELEHQRKQLPTTLQKHYVVNEWVSEEELGWIYQHATVAIGRAGANTVAELIAHRLPAILVPLPFAHHDEQYKNAEYMKNLGGAEIILQKDLTTDYLLKTLNVMKKYHRTMRMHLAEVSNDQKSAEKLYSVLSSVVK